MEKFKVWYSANEDKSSRVDHGKVHERTHTHTQTHRVSLFPCSLWSELKQTELTAWDRPQASLLVLCLLGQHNTFQPNQLQMLVQNGTVADTVRVSPLSPWEKRADGYIRT